MLRQTLIYFVVVLFSALGVNALAQTKAEKIDQLMAKNYEVGRFNGTVLVAEKGQIIYQNGLGYADFEWDIPNKPDTKFRLASITKQFAATLIMQLVEEGKLSLDGKITDYLPDYRKDTGDQVTIHQLLTHTSGIPSYTGLPNFMEVESKNYYPKEEFVKRFCSGDLEFEPGTEYSYNNSGYYLLGVIIENVTGQSFDEVLNQMILEPAGMINSGMDKTDHIIKNRAAGYSEQLAQITNSSYLDMDAPFSAGAMYSTVEDLYIWDRALATNKLISSETLATMYKPFLNGYGYGWGVFDKSTREGNRSVKAAAHGGGINGFSTYIIRLYEDDHLIVLLNNIGGLNSGPIVDEIIQILYDEPFQLPKHRLSAELANLISNDGIEAAVAKYHELKTNDADKYDFSEPVLNRFGYQLLFSGKKQEAIAMFKLNSELFPDSANTYDSLAQGYMENGQNTLAIQNYEKSLEMNPDNQNARDRIKRIKEGN